MAGGLLKRLARSNRVLPRKLRFTREGRIYVLITFGIGLAAINTGNNLLYLLLGMLLSLILLSGFLSEMVVHRAHARRLGIPEIHARAPAEVGLEIANESRRLSGYALRVREHIEDEGVEQVPTPIFHLPPGERRALPLTITFARRGRYRSYGPRVETEFPFSLFEKARLYEEPAEYLVFPALLPGVELDALMRRLAGEQASSRRVGRGMDVYGVRDFRQGDPPNRVHWKLTARRGQLVTREFEEWRGREVRVLLVNAAHDHAAGEAAVSLAATVVVALAVRDRPVALASLETLAERPGLLQGRVIALAHLAEVPIRRADAAVQAAVAGFLGERRDRWLVVAPPGLDLDLPAGHALVHAPTSEGAA